MIDPEGQKALVEELKRKIRKSQRSSKSHEEHGGKPRREVGGETTEACGNLAQGNRREDNMWVVQGQAELDADQMASEAGTRRLEALERELQDQEEERQKEAARLRAEELKKRSWERENVAVDKPGETIRVVPDDFSEPTSPFISDAGQIYLEVMLLAYRDGKPDMTAADILDLLRQRFGLTDKEHQKLLQKVQLAIYTRAMAEAWRNGVGTRQAFEKLDVLREQLSISADDHLRLERQARRQTLQRTATAAA